MKAFIFDLDGVIVFTDRFHYQAWKKIADQMGIYFDEEINNRLRGVSRMDSLDIILERYEGEPLSQERKEARHRGYKLSLGSSSKNAKFILERVGLLDAFDAISDGTNISKSKPDPEVFLKGAEFLGVEPAECVVVEDALAGIDAAKAGNMMAAGIGEARDYDKTDFRLDTFSDLLQIGR